jgi:hypothetical protein
MPSDSILEGRIGTLPAQFRLAGSYRPPLTSAHWLLNVIAASKNSLRGFQFGRWRAATNEIINLLGVIQNVTRHSGRGTMSREHHGLSNALHTKFALVHSNLRSARVLYEGPAVRIKGAMAILTIRRLWSRASPS